mmetsp:Transcript_9332/g.25358  ORF Transcript_9332/g.25358 Transcript_9332/m.25358 type:complete len:324 (-) Transcript_9332:223-1194(-)
MGGGDEDGSMQAAVQFFATNSKQIVHDVSFDYYGKRVATVSSDRCITVFDLNEEGVWKESAKFKGAGYSMWKVSWAHPEFGQIIAVSTFGKQVNIWQEGPDLQWKASAELAARASVVDVKFAPYHFGLMLAYLSQDGQVKVAVCPNPLNIDGWKEAAKPFDIQPETERAGGSLDWNPSRFDPPSLAVGRADGAVRVFAYNSNQRIYVRDGNFKVRHNPPGFLVRAVAWAPNPGRSFHLIASVSGEQICIWRFSSGGSDSDNRLVHSCKLHENGSEEKEQACSVAWNTTGTALLVSGEAGTVCVYTEGEDDEWILTKRFNCKLS